MQQVVVQLLLLVELMLLSLMQLIRREFALRAYYI